jgi:hypothetical protein
MASRIRPTLGKPQSSIGSVSAPTASPDACSAEFSDLDLVHDRFEDIAETVRTCWQNAVRE